MKIVYSCYNFIPIVLLISSKELSQIYLITEYMMYFYFIVFSYTDFK